MTTTTSNYPNLTQPSQSRITDTQTHTHTIMVLPMVEYNERLKTNKDGYRKKGEPKNQWILFV